MSEVDKILNKIMEVKPYETEHWNGYFNNCPFCGSYKRVPNVMYDIIHKEDCVYLDIKKIFGK